MVYGGNVDKRVEGEARECRFAWRIRVEGELGRAEAFRCEDHTGLSSSRLVLGMDEGGVI
jgi:hypothetical protein